jgi:hypothetical protein
MGHAMTTAARVVHLRGRSARNVPQPRAKKQAPSFPTANQLAQVIAQLRTLVSTGEAPKVDGELDQLLRSMSLDPASPDAWRDAVLLLGALFCGIGKPRRTNKSAGKLSAAVDLVLLHEMIRLRDQGLSQEQAISRLAGDQSKARLLKLKAMSTTAQRVEALSKRVSAIKKSTSGWKVFGATYLSAPSRKP